MRREEMMRSGPRFEPENSRRQSAECRLCRLLTLCADFKIAAMSDARSYTGATY
jgi:hypothetical protein